MAVLEIHKYPHIILRKKAAPIQKISQSEKDLAKDMVETMRYFQGVGLAAPQVGVSLRLIIVNPYREKGEEIVIVNPEIIKQEGKTISNEGCLSIPNVKEDIRRARKVSARGMDIEGNLIELDAEGLLARVLQHEVDHINGILIIDKLGFLKRLRYRKQRRA
jgi:peptide deformylase